MIQDKLEREIDSLINLIKPFSEESILMYIATEMNIYTQTSSIFETTGLSSPYMQYLYLCNLSREMGSGMTT